MITKKTLIVNLFGGPGSGKTTCSWEIASELKKMGYITEYVPEYAKELVWDNALDLLDGSLINQKMILVEQQHRIERLLGKVDFIITDSPVLMNPVYLQDGLDSNAVSEYKVEILDLFKSNANFCMFIERGGKFENTGRIHNLEQSKEIDIAIKNILEDNNIYFGTYGHTNINLSVKNCIKTYNRINRIKQSTQVAEEQSTKSITNEVARANENNDVQEEQVTFELTPNM